MHKIPKQPRQSQFCGGSKSRIASIVLLPLLYLILCREKRMSSFRGENKVQQMKREWDGWNFFLRGHRRESSPSMMTFEGPFGGLFFSVPRTSARKSKVILFMWCVCGIALRNKRERESRAAYTQSFRFFPHSYSKRRPFLIFCVVPQRRKEKA